MTKVRMSSLLLDYRESMAELVNEVCEETAVLRGSRKPKGVLPAPQGCPGALGARAVDAPQDRAALAGHPLEGWTPGWMHPGSAPLRFMASSMYTSSWRTSRAIASKVTMPWMPRSWTTIGGISLPPAAPRYDGDRACPWPWTSLGGIRIQTKRITV